MNSIEGLIERLCPDGVEYKALKEIGSVDRGGSFQKKDFVEEGMPCIHYGQIYTKFGLHAAETFTFVSETVFEESKKAHPGDVVMAVTSENIEDVSALLGLATATLPLAAIPPSFDIIRIPNT